MGLNYGWEHPLWFANLPDVKDTYEFTNKTVEGQFVKSTKCSGTKPVLLISLTFLNTF